MKNSAYSALIVVAIGILCLYFGVFDATNDANKAKDEMRWVKIENAEIFQGMGARLWKLHVPASDLDGKSKFLLKWAIDAGNPETVLTARLKQNRNAANPVDLTIVLYPNHWSIGLSTHFGLTLASDEFTEQVQVGNPLPRSTHFKRLNELGDLSKGIELCAILLKDDDDLKGRTVRILLFAE